MKTVSTSAAPSAIGPYSQAIVANGFVFSSGQIALDPVSGELVGGGVEAEARKALQNLRAVLEAAGSSMDRVVKCTVFLVDMADFAAVNAVYAEAFGDHRPARSTVAVAGLPKGVRVEVEAVGVVSG
ncbi:MAG: RidA family protein [Myxococcales bacterium]|nr:RidA family protein [Myxococcales bacterium]